MKYIKLFESYKSLKETEDLARDIIIKCAEKTFDDIAEYIVFMNRQNGDYNEMMKDNGKPYIERPIEKLHSVGFDTDFKEDYKKYNVLQDFIKESGTYVNFKQFGKSKTTKGSFTNSYWGREIKIYYDKHVIGTLNDMYESGSITESGDILFVIHSENIIKILVHELTHSYDDWRSNGKAIVQPDEYKKHKQKATNLKKMASLDGKLTDDEIEFLDKQHKDYLNLKHEVDARFVHTLKDHKPIYKDTHKVKTEDLEWVIEDWKKYYRDFKLYFDGWDGLSDDVKRQLTRRLSQFYEFEKETLKDLNKELYDRRKKEKLEKFRKKYKK